MRKFSLVLALAVAVLLTIGAAAALAAPGDYPPNQTSDKYTAPLTSGGEPVSSVNANKTGQGTEVNDGTTAGDVIKNVEGERTHGEYQNDTNSCASCHQTHTASGETLLFQDGVYNTCSACHDGTLGFYNVFEPSNAGTFGGDPSAQGGNASVHLATGVMTVSAAPGGNHSSSDSKTWGANFTCASCHSPHGSYSDRLLNYNPNGVGTRPASDGGTLVTGATVKADSVNAGHYIADQYVTGQDSNGANVYAAAPAGPYLSTSVYGKPKNYDSKIWYDANGNGVLDVTKDATGKVTSNEAAAPNDLTKSWNDVVTINYRDGYFTDPNGVIAANNIDMSKLRWNLAPATVVKMTETTLQQNGTDLIVNGVPITTVTGYQQGVSEFCAACHTDYNSKSAQTESGTFSQAFRHKIVQGVKAGMIGQVNSKGGTDMVCLTCHYAHGTDKSIQKDARDQAVSAPDVNPSSALKRYVNMSVCWKCHTSSHSDSFTNSDSYWDQKDAGTLPIN